MSTDRNTKARRVGTDPLSRIAGLSSPPRLDKPEEIAILLGAAPKLVRRKRLAARPWRALLQAAFSYAQLGPAKGADPAALRRGAKAVVATARERIAEDTPFADRLGVLAYDWLVEKRWDWAIALFDLVIDNTEVARTGYNNALYAVMADNNGQPVDRERAERFLARCLPHGAENPSIFYNAACIYTELDDKERTYENIAAALAHGYPQPEKIRTEELFARYADDPEFVALFAPPRP